MPSIDWSIDKLVTYRPDLSREPDFYTFWAETLAAARSHDLNPVLEPVDYPIRAVRVQRLTFSGFGGRRVHGWYLQPRDIDARQAPVLVQYHGYSGGAGQVHAYLPWVMLGCAVVTVDTRGQGGGTGDPDGYEGGSIPGWMTQGILDPAGYYYRKSYTDCVRAIDFVFSRPELDTRHICVTGGSQGGGLTLAVAGLEPRVTIAMPDVPYLCHYQRAVDIAGAGPYLEIQRYFQVYPHHVEQALRTLSYHDGMNLAAGIAPHVKLLCSVGLWDDVCPPSTVYAAYNHAGAERKEMAVYPYNKHEGGGGWHMERKIAFLSECLAE